MLLTMLEIERCRQIGVDMQVLSASEIASLCDTADAFWRLKRLILTSETLDDVQKQLSSATEITDAHIRA
jgi:hypothetical protein